MTKDEQDDFIIKQWAEFARTKVFAFRGVTEAAYKLFFPAYVKAILRQKHC